MCVITACFFGPDFNLKEGAITVWMPQNFKLIRVSSITLFCKIKHYWMIRVIGQQHVFILVPTTGF